ncbi:MAG: ketopantoate reductase family protein [Fusobacteriaceae bacterium]|jgi:2-dehydropantoate 2-reductase|nr:ketopantoate reductase family protein [Fusobacteriaceae bacterium]
MKAIKTVSLIGLGAIGSYFACNLQTVLGDNLRIVAGGERGQRIRKNGIIANGTQYYFNVVDPATPADPADLVIIITKMTGLRQALEDIRNHVGPDSILMAPLNGVEKEEIVASVYGWDRLLYSLTRVSVLMVGNTVSFDPKQARIEFGEKTNESVSPRVQAVADLFAKAGVKPKIQPDMIRAIWHKYMCNLAENQVSALLHVPFGAWNGQSVHATALREMVMREVARVAAKKGIILTEEEIRIQGEKLKAMPYNNKSSTLRDLEEKRKTEIDMFGGTLCRIAKEVGEEAPVNEFLYHAIKVLEEKNEGLIKERI